MAQYISMWSRKELALMKRREALSKLGIKENGVIIQPPICKECGGGCIEVDLGTKYLQCLECGFSSEAHEFTSTWFRGDKDESSINV